MRITVKVKTSSRHPGIKRVGLTEFEVAVAEPPIEGKANQAVIKAIAKWLRISSLDIELASGHTSRNKILNIPEGCLPPWDESMQLGI